MSIQNGYTILNPNSLDNALKRIINTKQDAYMRKGSFSTDIIWQGRRFVFPNPKKNITNNMWIFKSVIKDVKDYILVHRIKEKPKLPVNHWNPKNKNFDGKITATDLDHAYWRVAFLYEYISMKTYLKGLEVKDKSLRLAALANLSSMKEYLIIKNGVITDETIILKYDPILHKVYNNIRFTCYEHMMNIAELLKDNFICYKTDCVYYKDTKANRTLVQEYLDSVAMEWKQLVEPEKPTKND
jgi:hypothetical protein